MNKYHSYKSMNTVKVGVYPCTYQVNNEFWCKRTDEEKQAWKDIRQGMLQWLYDDEDKEESIENTIRKDIAAQRAAIIENLDYALYGFVELMRKDAWDKVEASALINQYCIQISTVRETMMPEYKPTPMIAEDNE